ncbi:MAG: hypothetical protein GXP27_05550, partial [Planctomycetes bacterium]|nr:hypothetical protein [Planctomycetota bacterium]
QLVAIKKLQARGASLLDVQRALAGADDETLNRLAGLPADFWESLARSGATQAETTSGGGTVAKLSAVVRQEFAAESKEAAAKVDPRALPFWQVVPSRMPSASDEFETAAAPSVPSRQAKSVQAAAHLKVAPGVTLVLEGVRPEQLTPDVLCEVQPAVRALLRSLQRHDVIPLQSDGEDS